MGRQTPGSVDAAWQIVRMADEDNDGVATDALTRRGLLRAGAIGAGVAGAAWVTPTVLTMDAAAATSGCAHVLDWSSFAVGSTFTSATVGPRVVSLTTSLFTFGGGTATTPGGLNRTIVAGPQGSLPGNFLRIAQNARQLGGQQVTFTFDASVTAVTFTITDIDTLTGAWSDRVAILTPFTPSAAGANVIGAGANDNNFANTGVGPFRANVSSNIPPTSPDGNITITVAGPTTSVVLRFWSGLTGTSQLINISNISFLTC